MNSVFLDMRTGECFAHRDGVAVKPLDPMLFDDLAPIEDQPAAGLSLLAKGEMPSGTYKAVVSGEVRELLVQADAAIEKSRGLLKQCRALLLEDWPIGHPTVAPLLAEITDLLGD